VTRHSQTNCIPKGLSPFSEDTYRDLPLANLAAYAMAMLDDASVPLTIENITVALFKLFPVCFAMVGFPSYPDGTRANRTLLQMQPKYRNYATGSAKRGYSLTALGRKAAEATETILTSAGSKPHIRLGYERDAAAKRGNGAPRTIHDEDLLAQVRESLLFQAYIRGDLDTTLGVDFLGILGVFSHTPKALVRRELKHLQEAAERQGDQVLQDFLRECRQRFSGYLQG